MPSYDLGLALWALVHSGAVFAAEVRFPAAAPANIAITGQLQEPSIAGAHPAVILLHTGGGPPAGLESSP